MSYFYAQLDDNNLVIGISELAAEVSNDRLIALAGYDDSVVGKRWDGTDFVAVVKEGFELRVTGIVADAEHAARTVIADDLTEVTCPTGTVLTVSGELLGGNGAVVPLSEQFRMPLYSRDGRERVLLAQLNAGQSTIVAPMRESGVWLVNEDGLNSELPPQMQMRFVGIAVTVYEVV